MSEENKNDFRDLMRTFRQKKNRLLEEIKINEKYIKHIKNKLKLLAEEEDNAIAGIKNFDDDQLSIFDLGNVKNEFDQGGELDKEDDGEESEPITDEEDMDDDEDLDIEDPDDEEDEDEEEEAEDLGGQDGTDAVEDDDDTGPIEFEEDEEEATESEEAEAEPAIR